MRIAVVVVALVVLGCGDNIDGPDPDETGRCAPAPPELPTVGRFADPLALPLPASCVPGGLATLPDRWFVVDPESSFSFDYPKFEGDCETGFTRAFDQEDDLDASDGFTYHTWSDGTRFYTRFNLVFEQPPDPVFEFTSAFAACMLTDGTLAAVRASYDTDRGERMTAQVGTRFGLKDEPAEGLSLVGELAAMNPETPIIGYNVVVDGTHAYVVGPAGMFVVDVSTPATPVAVGFVEGAFNDVRVVRGAGKVVAFASPIGDEMTFVIDVTDPTQPTIVSQLPEYSHSVQVTTGAVTHLYLATYTDVVPRYDVTNPLVPVRLGAAMVPGEPAGVHDLFVDGNTLYINNTTAGFVALDVGTGLGTAVERGRIPTSYSHASVAGTTTSGRKVILHGDEGMTRTSELGAFLRIIDGDSTSPTYMQELARYQSRPEVGIHNIELSGNRVYLSYYQDGIRVVDIANPAQPREVAHYNTWDPETAPGRAFEGAVGVRLAGGLIYVADMARGLVILREN